MSMARRSDDSLTSTEYHYSEVLPTRKISTQVLNRLPKHEELKKHALKRWVTLLGPIDFDNLLQHATSISRTPLESQTFVKLLYRRLPVNHYTKSQLSDAKACKRCGFEDETISHAVFECRQSFVFWTQVHKCLQRLLAIEIDEISLKDVIYFFPALRKALSREQLHVLNVVHSVALYNLWSSRYLLISNYRSMSYEYDRHGVDLNRETFNMRLSARIEIEYYESVRLDSPMISPTPSESLSSGNSSHYLYSVDNVVKSPSQLHSATDSGCQLSSEDPEEEKQIGIEEKSFLSRWCSSNVVSVTSNGKVVINEV